MALLTIDTTTEMALNGFILTRQWTETANGLQLTFWLASENGPLRFRATAQEAVCFFPTRQQAELGKILGKKVHYRTNPTELKNFNNEIMSALYFKSQRALFDLETN